MPLVPCPHDTTGKPPAGGLPLGIAMSPVTATGLLPTVCDTYITRNIVPCRPVTGTGADFSSFPAIVGSGCGTE